MSTKTFSLDELCLLTDYSKRTVRYYIQLGLVSRPVGESRAAYYTSEHLGQLLRIKQLSADGVSLERIQEILHGEVSPVPPRLRKSGTIEVRSHIYVAPGIEIQVVPEEAGISPESLRTFAAEVIKIANVVFNKPGDSSNE